MGPPITNLPWVDVVLGVLVEPLGGEHGLDDYLRMSACRSSLLTLSAFGC